MPFKFERLEVWELALDYSDLIYEIAGLLPRSEEFNLKSQITRAATSVSLNIAEGSTGQTDAEQARFIGLAIRSLIETVACQHIIARRGFLEDNAVLRKAYRQAEVLVAKLHTFRKAVAPNQNWLREEVADYVVSSDMDVFQNDAVDNGLPSSFVLRPSSIQADIYPSSVHKEINHMTNQIVFTRGVPPTEAFPAEELSICFESVLSDDTAVVLQYGQQPGYLPLRRQLAEEYGVSEKEIMVGNGSLQLQDLVSAYLIKPGATVLVEQPSYDRAITTFRRRGAKVIGIPLEEDGINIERLEAQLKRDVPAFIYLVPDFQNPTGATMSLEKRRAVVDLANRYGFWIIEDVPYRKLRYAGEDLLLLREIDPQHIITMSSFSKLLAPALRVGYMVAPADFIAAVTKLGEDTYLAPVLPTQAAVAEYIKRGWLGPNIEHLKELYSPRWRAMVDAVQRELPGAKAFLPEGGFFVSVMLPDSANTTNLVERAKEHGLVLTPGQAFFADPDDGKAPNGEKFVRLPFCAVTPEQINEGVRRLAALL